VCTENRDPDELVIIWEPMERIDHNGENFKYVVSYRQRKIPGAPVRETEVTDYRQSELVVPNQNIFSEYEISVRAKNDIGLAPENTVQRKIGYSGEDVPLISPENFAVDESSINSTYAMFMWDPVEDDPAMIRGFFKGYEIHFWRVNDPDDVKKEEIIVNEWNPCPDLNNRNLLRRRRQTQMTAHTNDLWPYSQITAGILVTNGGKSGALGDLITFSTPEGLPTAVMGFKVTEFGSHHLKVEWEPPLSPNGILLGYVVGWRTAPEGDKPLGDLREEDVDNPLQLYKKIHGLKPMTKYLLYIWAKTKVGRGIRDSDEATTRPDMPPDEPGFGPLEPGPDYVNVSFVPTARGEDSDNPGSEFYIEYRPSGSGDSGWEKSDPEKEHNWINVTNLEPGQYEFRIVAKNGSGQETRSKSKTVVVGPTTDEIRTASVATAGWFIALMIIILFLLLILIIVCIIKRNRGGKYPVHEKEKLRGRDPDDEEAPFGEYTRTEPDYKKSQGSIDSEQKPLESDTDSMAEYDDPDTGKFNEDGSFIGQYGGKKRGSQKENDINEKNQSALSTFV
jgi:receptor-type tyrosine-protein phosphatase zeta